MGYRSQVVLAISKHLTPFLTLACSQEAEAQALVFKHHDTFDRNYDDDKSWLITWEGVKWYDSYPDVQAIEKFVQEACSDEYEFEDEEGNAQASSQHIKFVRVGEEDADIESYGDGCWDIYATTNICY